MEHSLVEWDTILAHWEMGSLSGSPVERSGNGYLNDQQYLEWLGEYYGLFAMPIRRFYLTIRLGRARWKSILCTAWLLSDTEH